MKVKQTENLDTKGRQKTVISNNPDQKKENGVNEKKI